MEFLHTRCLRLDCRDDIAVRAPGNDLTVTYGGLSAAVEAVAGLLESAGIGPGMRVAIIVPASLELIVSVLAVSRCGAAAAPLDVSLRGLSLAHAIERVDPAAGGRAGPPSDAEAGACSSARSKPVSLQGETEGGPLPLWPDHSRRGEPATASIARRGCRDGRPG